MEDQMANRTAQAGQPRRLATNVSLNESLVLEAKALNINLSRAAERGLEAAVTEARAERWLAENRAAIDEQNAWVEKNGLILARQRLF
jgi:antitoxin CcdA